MPLGKCPHLMRTTTSRAGLVASPQTTTGVTLQTGNGRQLHLSTHLIADHPTLRLVLERLLHIQQLKQLLGAQAGTLLGGLIVQEGALLNDLQSRRQGCCSRTTLTSSEPAMTLAQRPGTHHRRHRRLPGWVAPGLRTCRHDNQGLVQADRLQDSKVTCPGFAERHLVP